nr:tetratricopeptide repeat protein [Achromobacter aestuarii]
MNRLDAAGFAAILAGPREHAIPWVAAAAELGVVDAQAVYGQWLLDGDGIPRDAASGLAWFKRAAQTGHAMSMNMVGRCYENGWGVMPHAEVAAYWFRLASEAGLDWGMYNYATSLALGRGVAEDKRAALALLERARALGHLKSINLIGGFYEEGWVVAQDAQAAMRCYAEAAEGGDFRGQFNYARGLMASGDVAAALVWLERVPQTATASFLIKLLAYLDASPHPAARSLGQSLAHAHLQA